MKELYVYDFDGTLINYDSFKNYIFFIWRKMPIKIGFLIFIRLFKIINRREFKKRIVDIVDNNIVLQELSKQFANKISKDIKKELIYNNQIVILTASPMCYMKHLTDLLNVECVIIGTDYFNDVFIEMYGETKKEFLINRFSQNEYIYKYSASDSESDLIWMQLFNKYDLIK